MPGGQRAMTDAPSTEHSNPVFAKSMEAARRTSEQAAAECNDRVVVAIGAVAKALSPALR
jgi:hypothetical protein